MIDTSTGLSVEFRSALKRQIFTPLNRIINRFVCKALLHIRSNRSISIHRIFSMTSHSYTYLIPAFMGEQSFFCSLCSVVRVHATHQICSAEWTISSAGRSTSKLILSIHPFVNSRCCRKYDIIRWINYVHISWSQNQ